MKRLAAIVFLIATFVPSSEAQFKLPVLDKSPMDMSYYPVDYPVLKVQNKVNEPLLARVVYSRPQKNGRRVFGELVEYGQIWRLGANEATEIELYRDCRINGEKLRKGRYTMYAIPHPGAWTIIINKETDSWGAFIYDPKKDVLRTEIKTEHLEEAAEVFSMTFCKTETGVNLVIAWDDVKATIPFNF